MEFEDDHHLFSSPSSSSSSLDQITDARTKPTHAPPSHKKRAGRKIFKETRHPIYRGVRQKNGGKWVCEVRDPHKKSSRIWLGTFPDPETAAVAHDVAALGLRGENAPLNFPNSARCLPRAISSSHQDIRRAALQAARDFLHFGPCYFNMSLRDENKYEVVEQNLNLVKNVLSDLNIEKQVLGGNLNDSCVSSCRDDVVGFVDEEPMFNMPVFLHSMAEGMLLTPPAMKKGFSWSHEFDDQNIDLTLWVD